MSYPPAQSHVMSKIHLTVLLSSLAPTWTSSSEACVAVPCLPLSFFSCDKRRGSAVIKLFVVQGSAGGGDALPCVGAVLGAALPWSWCGQGRCFGSKLLISSESIGKDVVKQQRQHTKGLLAEELGNIFQIQSSL